MPLAHFKTGTLFFAHVPKAGGTSVENYLIRRFGPLSVDDRNRRAGRRKTGLIIPASHLSAEDLTEFIPHDVAYVFAVVRHPVDRLMSEYRYQSGVSRMSRLGFALWLRLVIHAARLDKRVYENHIRPQCDLIPEGSDIFRLEDGFDGLIRRIDETVGTSAPDIRIEHLNKRQRKSLQLSRQDVQLITSFYSEDFDKLGYDMPDPDALAADKWVWAKDALARVLAVALVQKQRWTWAR